MQNNKQIEIYNWLKEHKGYLKKGKIVGWELCPIESILEDFEIALKQARIDFKDSYNGSNTYDQDTPKRAVKASNEEFWEQTAIYKKREAFYEQLIQEKQTNKVNNRRNAPGTYLVTGCCHAPWHNQAMYDSVFNYLGGEKIVLQGLILAGDVIDANSLSSHDRGKTPIKGVTLDWEYKEANKFLDQFEQLRFTPNATKDYLWGNHEDRYLRIKKDVDIAKYGDALVGPDVGLKLIERGYNVYKDWKNDTIQLGPYLDVTHGEFLSTHSAKKTIDTYRKSVLYFHTHRFQVYVEGLVGGWNMGFGGDINAPIFGFATRAMKNSWINACALVDIDEDGYYHVSPLMYINSKLIVNGKSY